MSSASSIFETVILEIRPRLQSVNVFVSLINEPESVEVVLEKESVRIITEKGADEIHCGDISIVRNSLSSVKVDDAFLTFRFATNNLQERAGGFKTELLQNTVASMESMSNKPLLSKNTTYTVHCVNCGKSLTGASLKFDRVLPLPSENSDASDWFCHAQSRTNGPSLDPKKTDVFYSQCFVHLNADTVANLKCSGKLAVCKFCLQWLGIRHNPSTIRLWFNTVTFVNFNTCVTTSSLQDVFKTVKSVFKYSFHSSVKVILSCQSSPVREDHVLVWILEKNLQVLFNGSGSVKRHEVAKVLFRFVEGEEDATLKSWQDDSLVGSFSVSKVMMVELLKHLHRFNRMFPAEFSTSNDFKISYLLLND